MSDVLTEQVAEAWLAEHCFDTGPAGFVGATVEMLPVSLMPVDVPAGPVFQRLRHGHLSGDYAGVLVMSSPPSPGLDVCVRRTAEDVALARDVLARHGFAAGERALDPFTPGGDRGAAVTVCLDAGSDGPDLARRWAVAHAVGPVLTAAFANAPLRAGRPTGLRSARRRGTPIVGTASWAAQPRLAWADHVLDPALRQRLRDGGVTVEVLRRHLDTLPGPVRARGHLELSMIDAQPADGWRVAVAVTAALVDDARAADEALAATEALGSPGAADPDLWARAARDGLADPALAEVARQCFLIAYAALGRQGVSRALRDDVATFIEGYVNRSRCPADDVLDAVRV
jgi:glutamate--cysteine ligase